MYLSLISQYHSLLFSVYFSSDVIEFWHFLVSLSVVYRLHLIPFHLRHHCYLVYWKVSVTIW